MSVIEWIILIFVGVPVLYFGLAAFVFGWFLIISSIFSRIYYSGRPTRRQRKALKKVEERFALLEEDKNA